QPGVGPRPGPGAARAIRAGGGRPRQRRPYRHPGPGPGRAGPADGAGHRVPDEPGPPRPPGQLPDRGRRRALGVDPGRRRMALGVFGFYRRERAYFTPYQRRLMKEFARLASLTLQRTELSAATARAAGRLQVGVDAAHDLAGTLAPGAVVRALIDRALAATGA